MCDETKLCSRPVFFRRNRVFRVYRGGKLFHDFFGDPPEDGNFPEEWVASQVLALNRERGSNTEGLSFAENSHLPFSVLMEKHKQEMLGDSGDFDILVKLLDSAVRLPVQAHPDRAFSERYFNSKHGKTEMWLILQTRPDACIYLGFKDKTDKQTLSALTEASMTDRDVMIPYLNRVDVKPGDVYLIPAKTVHAIGAGCLILEVQEPTDFTIQPEHMCDDYKLSEYEMYLGLSKDVALDCFDYGKYGADIVGAAKKTPLVIGNGNGRLYEQLIGAEDTPCFRVYRHTLTDTQVCLSSAPSLFIVTEGSGLLSGEYYTREIRKGDYFFLPFAAKSKFTLKAFNICLVECKSGW